MQTKITPSTRSVGRVQGSSEKRLSGCLMNSNFCTGGLRDEIADVKHRGSAPLQLLDFAYRYSSSILDNALHLSSDAYVLQQTRARDNPGGGFREANGQAAQSQVEADEADIVHNDCNYCGYCDKSPISIITYNFTLLKQTTSQLRNKGSSGVFMVGAILKEGL
ncbi:hypothetical protein BDZ45DRAFT_740858 [Acephala macrosclerotiorum]|nr:hypothetical protein BDZ45DRAFT_740858 [Acephala macrosclerotiorum]